MHKQLTELTKEELISIVQDYQEMVSAIEEELNISSWTELKARIRDILAKHL